MITQLQQNEFAEEVKTIRVRRNCPKENCNGEMLSNGKVILIYPKHYEHTCNICKLDQIYPNVYPRIIF